MDITAQFHPSCIFLLKSEPNVLVRIHTPQEAAVRSLLTYSLRCDQWAWNP